MTEILYFIIYIFTEFSVVFPYSVRNSLSDIWWIVAQVIVQLYDSRVLEEEQSIWNP